MITELERLHQLFTQGALSEAEFAAAKASLLKAPSADLLKLDELRDELNRLQRDWDEERRKYLNQYGQEPHRFTTRFIQGIALLFGCFTTGVLVFAISKIIQKNEWEILPVFIPGVAITIGFLFLANHQARMYVQYHLARQSYEARRAELESQIAALRNQLRGEAHGS